MHGHRGDTGKVCLLCVFAGASSTHQTVQTSSRSPSSGTYMVSHPCACADALLGEKTLCRSSGIQGAGTCAPSPSFFLLVSWLVWVLQDQVGEEAEVAFAKGAVPGDMVWIQLVAHFLVSVSYCGLNR